MKLIRYSIFLVFCFFQLNINAQKAKFTSDTAYMNELRIFMGYVDKNQPDPVFTSFESLWNGGQFTNNQKQTIIQISNNLNKKRAKANPHFNNFLKYILSVKNSQIVSGQFDLWLKILENYSASAENNIALLDRFIDKLVQLNDSSILYQSRAVLWKHNSGQYRLELDVNNKVRIHFPKTDLLCYSKRDSSIIHGTSGYYYPQSESWLGSSGSVSWERAGLSKDSVYARFNNYRLDLKFSEYKADTVEFINKKYLKSSLTGRFEERLLANITPEKAGYPKFFSYERTIDIKDVVPNIDYSGGFAMEGAKFIGFGDSAKKAELFVYKDKDLFTKASSTVFVFDKNNILSNNTRIYIFIEQDTIWHPGLNFNYLINIQRLALTRSGTGLFKSKFYNTYHKLDIDISEISFNLNDSLILFKSPPATTFRKAFFESSQFFSPTVYKEIALMDRVHPLEAVREIAPTVGETFSPFHLAHYLEKGESYAVNMLMRLSDMGFVNYDTETKIAYPEQKLFDYIRSNYGKKDYDAISIMSEPAKGNNAVMNLNDKVLTVYGVQNFVLSNNRRVGVIPDNSVIRIKKNLEIEFDGKLQAGLAWLSGKGMTFHYDSFYVQLQAVDSLTLTYRSEFKNKDSVFVYTPVESTIDSITGLLRIDYPLNKSGRKIYPVYPILESHGKSFVFYEQKLNGDTLYKRNSFYVENYPFEIDSLNTILAKNIFFKGNLKSGGVFPDFDEYLVVQKDNSLGFVHRLDSIGMPLYGGLAKYDNTIKLDNSGLKGEGKVNYLNTDIHAQKFYFYPDSMNVTASLVEMKKQTADSNSVRYPHVIADSVYISWTPAKDNMLLTSLDNPFTVFNDKAQLKGSLGLNKEKLSGNGTLTISDAQLDSKTYTFFDESLKADTSDFIIQPVKGQKSPFLTYNVNASIDFDKKLGVFNSNGQNSYIDLPVSQYKCYMNYFTWRMGVNLIDIGQMLAETDTDSLVTQTDSLGNVIPDSLEIQYRVAFADTVYSAEELAMSSKFESTHPNQDGLSYYAKSASYDINNYIIKANGVKFIQVADAFIYPSTALTIFSGAKIKTLSDARILANRTSRFHKFYDATVDILGAKRYTASADYEYYDRQDSLQIIHFKNIQVNNDIHTIANGEINEKNAFNLSPEFSYMGKISLFAPDEFIEFDGNTKINHACDKRLSAFWLRFKARINPDSIVIPLAEQPVDIELRKLETSIFYTVDSVGIYPAFLTTRKRFTDIPVLKAGGMLYYNVRTGYYEITDSLKLLNPEREGNYLSFHKKVCLLLGEGKFDMAANLGQVKLNPAGLIRYNLDSWQTQMDIMLGVDFFFNDAALKMMADKLTEAYALPPVDPMSKDYQRSLRELIGLSQRDAIMREFSLMGGFTSIPAEMNQTMFFSNLKMKWNHQVNAWQSDGKIGLGNIKGTQINKMLDGYIEVKKAKTGDILNIYLEIDPKNWYFFTYTRGTLKTISSDNAYNNAVTNLKDKFRKPPVKDDENPYMFFPATDRAKENFVDEIKKQKLAVQEQKDINLDFFDNNENIEQNETEQDDEETLNESEEKTNLIETEELEEEEIQKIEEIKTENEEKTNTEEGEKNLEKEKQVKENEIKTEEAKEKKEKGQEIKTDEQKKKEEKKKQEEEKEKIKYEEEEEGEGVKYEEEEEGEGLY